MVSRYRSRSTFELIRPALLGLLAAFAVTLLLIALFSLIFVIVEKIAESAVIPLALASAAVGCFTGALICTVITRCRGIIYGMLIGLAMFVVIWGIGLFCSDSIFGTHTIVKLILLLTAGAAGGCAGKSRRFSR